MEAIFYMGLGLAIGCFLVVIAFFAWWIVQLIA